jgi:hypothetical protein
MLVMNLDGIRIDNPDVGRVGEFGRGWCRQEQRSDAG